MPYSIKATKQFEKDIILAKKRGLNIETLNDIVEKLANGESLPSKNKDHTLKGAFVGKRECHIQSDWLLIYSKSESLRLITLVRAGSHSDLFG